MFLKKILFSALFLFCLKSFAFDFKQKSVQNIDSRIAVSSSEKTHSDLKLLPQIHPSSNFKIELEFRIEKQHRTPTPNAWETFWLFWSYLSTGDGLKETNYVAFKTNGIEIGTAFDSHGQRFIWTAADPKIQINKWQKILFTKKNKSYFLQINDQNIPIDSLSNLYHFPGRIGLYTEDAKVQIRNLHYSFESH